ncbi:MAG: hypothetical protein IIY70_02315 [Oscillospiraceae bacterium]|nr:hypothetical protein [Oscillospiraceae bacterium]
MTLRNRRLCVGALILLGVLFYVIHAWALLRLPHLYLDLGKLHLGNLISLGLSLLCLAFTWIAAWYLAFNPEEPVQQLKLPALGFSLLLVFSALFLRLGMGNIPCSYTHALSACKEEFRPENYQVGSLFLYPDQPGGRITAYRHYEKGDVMAETVTCSYNRDNFMAESQRVSELGLDSFLPPQARAAQETVCYYISQENCLWQVLVTPKSKTVSYSRFIGAEHFPSFAPQPAQPGSESDSANT